MCIRDRVTGADGFIGSHLTEELVRKGERVKAFCYYNSFGTWGWLDSLPPEIKNEIEVFMGDIRDPNGVRIAMEGQDVVYHLAALIAIPFSYHSPDSYVDTNIKGTLNVLNAARQVGTKRLLVTSTSEVLSLIHIWREGTTAMCLPSWQSAILTASRPKNGLYGLKNPATSHNGGRAKSSTR